MSEMTETDRLKITAKLEKLTNDKFKQQKLDSWRPVPSFGSTMAIFAAFGTFFLAVGIALYIKSD
jgi:hypothetical protein